MDTGYVVVNNVKLLSDLGWKSCVWLRCNWLERIAGSKHDRPCYADHLTDRSLRWGFNGKTPLFMHEASRNLRNHLLWKWWGIVGVIFIR